MISLISIPWSYYFLAGLIGLLLSLVYICYQGYKKVAASAMEGTIGIPCPPLSHPMLGHPEYMIHPLKHEMRLTVHNSTQIPIHQLVFMKQASLFVNDPKEALRVLLQFPSKPEKSYESYRYNINVPDILTSDCNNWDKRQNLLSKSLINLNTYFSNSENELRFNGIIQQLLQILDEAAHTESIIDIEKIYSLFSLDVVCLVAFDYQLNALSRSNLGDKVYESLKTIVAGQQQDGLYSFPHMRNVTAKTIDEANLTWKHFLQVIKTSLVTSNEHQSLEPDLHLSHALFIQSKTKERSEIDSASLTEEEIISEIHQIIHHGYECLAGTLMWATYALFRHRKIRKSLDSSFANKESEYLECFMKELFRRYPVAGNFPIRKCEEPGQSIAGIEIPVDIPIHVDMFSLHNSSHIWGDKAKEFLPERWRCEATNRSDPSNTNGSKISSPTVSRRRCPVQHSNSNESLNDPSNYADYHGTGFENDSLTYFPFSVGARSCPSSEFAVQLIRKSLKAVFMKFRLNVSEESVMREEDLGGSWMTRTITPWSHSNMLVKVTHIDDDGGEERRDITEKRDMNKSQERGEMRHRVKKKTVSIDDGDDDDEGWAKDE